MNLFLFPQLLISKDHSRCYKSTYFIQRDFCLTCNIHNSFSVKGHFSKINICSYGHTLYNKTTGDIVKSLSEKIKSLNAPTITKAQHQQTQRAYDRLYCFKLMLQQYLGDGFFPCIFNGSREYPYSHHCSCKT